VLSTGAAASRGLAVKNEYLISLAPVALVEAVPSSSSVGKAPLYVVAKLFHSSSEAVMPSFKLAIGDEAH
jgi:hypothetical protein